MPNERIENRPIKQELIKKENAVESKETNVEILNVMLGQEAEKFELDKFERDGEKFYNITSIKEGVAENLGIFHLNSTDEAVNKIKEVFGSNKGYYSAFDFDDSDGEEMKILYCRDRKIFATFPTDLLGGPKTGETMGLPVENHFLLLIRSHWNDKLYFDEKKMDDLNKIYRYEVPKVFSDQLNHPVEALQTYFNYLKYNRSNTLKFINHCAEMKGDTPQEKINYWNSLEESIAHGSADSERLDREFLNEIKIHLEIKYHKELIKNEEMEKEKIFQKRINSHYSPEMFKDLNIRKPIEKLLETMKETADLIIYNKMLPEGINYEKTVDSIKKNTNPLDFLILKSISGPIPENWHRLQNKDDEFYRADDDNDLRKYYIGVVISELIESKVKLQEGTASDYLRQFLDGKISFKQCVDEIADLWTKLVEKYQVLESS